MPLQVSYHVHKRVLWRQFIQHVREAVNVARRKASEIRTSVVRAVYYEEADTTQRHFLARFRFETWRELTNVTAEQNY